MADEVIVAKFACDEAPFAVYSARLREQNIECLNGIDPNYYRHVARINAAALQGDERQYAAVQLRIAYSQALETLFALLACAVQAPDCPVGWLLCYKQEHLKGVISKIHAGQPVRTIVSTKPVTWEVLARGIIRPALEEEQQSAIHEAFARLWRRLADDFLDAQFSEEYSSIKHGSRVRMGGFYFALGPEEVPGVSPDPEQMVTLTNSDFGLQFFSAEQMVQGDKRNLRLASKHRNWDPMKFVEALDAIATSISNVLVFLRERNGVPHSELLFAIPEDLDTLGEMWKYHVRSFNMTWNDQFDLAGFQPLSREEILSVYDKADADDGQKDTDNSGV
jgi:hypothetical protein